MSASLLAVATKVAVTVAPVSAFSVTVMLFVVTAKSGSSAGATVSMVYFTSSEVVSLPALSVAVAVTV